MPMYLITHRWTEKENLDAVKDAANFFSTLSKLPEGVEFLASYNINLGAYTLWRAPNKEAVMKIIEDYRVFNKNAEIAEVVQSYPPTVEYIVRVWRMLIALGKK